MLGPNKFVTCLTELFSAARHIQEMKKIFNRLNESLSTNVETGSVDLSDESVVVQDVEMPDIYSDYDPTVPDLKIIDVSSPTIDEGEGFNPYDTAILRNN